MQFTGVVMHGTKHGTAIGHPTANVRITPAIANAFQRDGVYAVRIALGNEIYGGVLFYGKRTLFHDTMPVCEICIFDFSGDVYDHEISVTLVAYMRPVAHVASEKALKRLIEADIVQAQKIVTHMHMIYLASDHGGFALKQQIAALLRKRNLAYSDCGPETLVLTDDYPAYAEKVARLVARTPAARGILICRGANGMAIAANKITGIRAAVAWDTETAKKSVADNHANILCLSADDVTPTKNKRIIVAWLAAKPSQAKRHVRRVAQIMNLEK